MPLGSLIREVIHLQAHTIPFLQTLLFSALEVTFDGLVRETVHLQAHTVHFIDRPALPSLRIVFRSNDLLLGKLHACKFIPSLLFMGLLLQAFEMSLCYLLRFSEGHALASSCHSFCA